jgi:hypothetical protein
MGREVRRVPLDFAHPLNEVWPGYINPHFQHRRNCPFCDGSGHNPATKQIADDWYDFGRTGRRWCDKLTQDEVDALVEAGRLREWRGRENGGWVTVPRTAAEVNAANGQGRGLLGDLVHDSINRWICIETRAKRLGVWGECATCGGDGEAWRSPEDRAAAEAWTPTEPPAGEGWQMWETTSEGSPISPVFPTAEALAEWLARTGASTFGRMTATYEQWLRMIVGDGSAVSMIATGGVLMSGVEAASLPREPQA